MVESTLPCRQLFRCGKVAHAVEFTFLTREKLIPPGLFITQEVVVGMGSVGVVSDFGAADTCEAQRVELDGRNDVVFHARFHVHREAPCAHILVHFSKPTGEMLSVLANNGRARDVAPVAGVGGVGEFMAQNIEHCRFAVFVEIGIDRVFGTAQVRFDEERAFAERAFRIAGAPYRKILADIGKRSLPLLARFDHVHAHAAVTYVGLQHKGLLQAAKINLCQLIGRYLAVLQLRVHRCQQLAHTRLVLERGNGTCHGFVFDMLGNPAKSVFRGADKAHTCVNARCEFPIIQHANAMPSGNLLSHAVAQHRLLGARQILNKLRSRKRLVYDHHGKVLSKGNQDIKQALEPSGRFRKAP